MSLVRWLVSLLRRARGWPATRDDAIRAFHATQKLIQNETKRNEGGTKR